MFLFTQLVAVIALPAMFAAYNFRSRGVSTQHRASAEPLPTARPDDASTDLLEQSSARSGAPKSLVRTLQGRGIRPAHGRPPQPMSGGRYRDLCGVNDNAHLDESIGDLVRKYSDMVDHEILMMIPQHSRNIRNMSTQNALELVLEPPGRQARLLYDWGILQQDRELISGGDIDTSGLVGAEARVSENVPGWLVIFDRKTALIPADQSNPRSGSIMIRNPVVVNSLRSVFTTVWLSAVPLDSTATTALNVRDREILRLMNSGLTDSAGARTLNISLRTYRRHVADIMRTLGAESRFQAGVAAHRLRWLY
ncbi:LuxR C-terminal-related transcriptional regulator [Streptomyces sp. NPDC055078]